MDEPAVASLEMQNEDSLFFWTFNDTIPDAERRLMEQQFGSWLASRYGSLPKALARWHGQTLKRDVLAEGRVGFRPLWNMFSEKTARDQDTARFMLETQSRFYAETYAFLRKLGFQGSITASNWITANPAVLGPLEKLSYMTGDFVDRHGYFSCDEKGPYADWSLRTGHTYLDRSALRFDAEGGGKPRQFVHPTMDPHYDGKPSMISETTWNRPNRYRSEAPLYYSVFGSLQGSDAIIHFALDGARWSVKPGYFMQPWTLMSPAMMGQFPAAALLFRRGLVSEGKIVARVELNTEDLLLLKGTPFPQDAALDELRLKDIPAGSVVNAGQRLDPLLCYTGRSEVRFTTTGPTALRVDDLRPFIDHDRQTVTSTTGETALNYGKGFLTIDAARCQGVSGNLHAAGPVQTGALGIACDLDLGHIIAVSLDDLPLATSRRILLQVMSEEKATGFATETLPSGEKRITSLGTDPWTVKQINGTVTLRRADANLLRVTALDFNGYPAAPPRAGPVILLQPATLYYLITRS